MSAKALLVLNRKSAARPDVRAAVKKIQTEADLRVVIPWSKRQMRKFIRKAIEKGRTRIVAGGGDGTVNSVMNAIMRCGAEGTVEMGMIPLGTGNDFARAYGDDGSDLESSLRHAVTGAPRPIDLGYVNGSYFVNVASGGFGAMITTTTPKETKRRLGGFAYTLTGLARLSELTPTPARLSIDGGATQEGAILALVIANNRFAGGGFEVSPEADVTDGLLDFGVLTSDSLFPGVKKAAEAMDHTPVLRSTFRSAVLETETPFHLNLDGEPMVTTRFEISVLPGRLNFVLPGTSG